MQRSHTSTHTHTYSDVCRSWPRTKIWGYKARPQYARCAVSAADVSPVNWLFFFSLSLRSWRAKCEMSTVSFTQDHVKLLDSFILSVVVWWTKQSQQTIKMLTFQFNNLIKHLLKQQSNDILVNLAKHRSLASRSRFHPSPPPRLHREEQYEALQRRIRVARMCSWLVDENEACQIFILLQKTQ